LIEDDGVLPGEALIRPLADYGVIRSGFIEGVELGRWGIPHVGAWRSDDVYDMQWLESATASSELLNEAGRAIGRSQTKMSRISIPRALIDFSTLYKCRNS
jgi:hypothetical protein